MGNIYKRPMTLDKQIEHLKEHKNVVFNEISEEEAKKFLYLHNYINVITPFKFYFCEKEKDGTLRKNENESYIYPKPVEFSAYVVKYNQERSKYRNIYNNIRIFEDVIGSVVTYEILNKYNLNSEESFNSFQLVLYKNIEKSNYSEEAKKHMKSTVKGLKKRIEQTNSIILMFDRLSLPELIMLYRVADVSIKEKTFNTLKKEGLTLGHPDQKNFDEDLNRLVYIRNCISHNNSLTILLNYHDVKTNDRRKRSEKKKYSTLIKKLH